MILNVVVYVSNYFVDCFCVTSVFLVIRQEPIRRSFEQRRIESQVAIKQATLKRPGMLFFKIR